ncbi:MAG: hypothetical protein AAEJ52_05965 [Myxococcota bacterium]
MNRWAAPWRPGVVAVAACSTLWECVEVIAWRLAIQLRNDRDWLHDIARMPTASIEGDLVTIRNVLNFDYRS